MSILSIKVLYNDIIITDLHDIIDKINSSDEISSENLTVKKCIQIINYINEKRNIKFKYSLYGCPLTMVFL
jgi:hypothetical protein